jgi:TrmH family RNA methyltransferase
MLEQLIVIVQRPQDATNVGAILRAMKNMGISQLRLVQPEPMASEVILRVAHHCEDLLDRMTTHATLDEALADLHYVVGTTAVTHRGRPQTSDMRHLATMVAAELTQGRVGLLFGQEDDGLNQAALDRCHLLVTLPANPDYPALNLAQAVLLLLYEVRMAVLAGVTPPELPPPALAQQADLERLFQLSERLLTKVGFFKGNQVAVMRKVRQMAYKARLTPEEVALLLAMVRQVERGT